jgi:hypothetical protein
MSPNRIVALLTPLVFAPLAGAIAAWLAEHFPGVEVDQGSLEQIFIAGALIALAPAAQWLHGWQKHEARQAELERDVALASAAAPAPASFAPEEDFEDGEEFDEPTDEADAFDEEDALDEDDALDELDALGESDDLDALDEDGLLDEDDPILAEG